MKINDILNKEYLNAKEIKTGKKAEPKLNNKIKHSLKIIVDNSANYKGIVNVLITSLTYKIYKPDQDIRYHQKSMRGGYSGRTIDTKYIAPFLKSKGFRSAKESGWLTRSLEQPFPYTLKYKGHIRNKDVKKSFLEVINYIERKNGSPRSVLRYLFHLLLIQKESNKITIKKVNNNISIERIISMLNYHFNKSRSYGRSRLPVLAIHSIYILLMKQVKRFDNKKLQELSSHTSADKRKGDIADIQVNNKNGTPFEAVEVKFGIPIDLNIINDAYHKIKTEPVKRYYILSTKDVKIEDLGDIMELCNKIETEKGCQIIVNGILKTINYYLRLIYNTNDFLNLYTKKVKTDKVIRYEHKKLWKDILESN